MIYKNADTIPAKLFFKIARTGDVSLLSTKKTKDFELLASIFEDISLEDAELNPDKSVDKELSIYQKMEALHAKYKKIKYAVFCLYNSKDEELIEILKKDGYTFTDDYEKSLKDIERYSESILNQIEAIKTRLPKQKEGKKATFDEVVLSYAAVVGSGFIDTNAITLTQYYALLKIGTEKINALNSQNGKR